MLGKFETHKSTAQGRQLTLNRRSQRSLKRPQAVETVGTVRFTRSGRLASPLNTF